MIIGLCSSTYLKATSAIIWYELDIRSERVKRILNVESWILKLPQDGERGRWTLGLQTEKRNIHEEWSYFNSFGVAKRNTKLMKNKCLPQPIWIWSSLEMLERRSLFKSRVVCLRRSHAELWLKCNFWGHLFRAEGLSSPLCT